MTTLSNLDYIIIKMYKSMVGINNLATDASTNTIVQGSLNINANINISGPVSFNYVNTFNNLNLSNTTFKNNITITNNLYSNNVICKAININNLNINSNSLNNLFVSNLSIINNNLSINSTLNCLQTTILPNIYTNNILPLQNTINIFSNNINIGSNPYSIINIQGTRVFEALTQLDIADKSIYMNLNITSKNGLDNGFDAGIQIVGISGTGFIKTSTDALRYQIKAPKNSNIDYITLFDINNNLNISNNSIFKNITLNSSLNILGNSLFNNSITMINNLTISGYSTLQNTNILNNFNINNIIVKNNTSFNSSLNINNFISSILNLNNSLDLNKAIFNNITTNNNLYLINSLFKNSTIFSSLQILNNSLQNNVIINKNLNISNYAILGNTTINNSLMINSYANFNNLTSNKLNISSCSIILGNCTFNSSININGNLINPLILNYPDNVTAKNNGLPIGAWYRTGGILKIRLNDSPPTIYLNGFSSIVVHYPSNYIDAGAYAIDYYKNYNLVYMTSLVTGTTNILSNNILITGTSTLITQTSLLIGIGYYTATYQATDLLGIVGFAYRTLNISSNLYVTPYSSSVLLTSALANSDGGTKYLPVVTISPNSWVWQAPINTTGLPSKGQAWTLSQQYLTSVNFNFNSSWCLVFRACRTFDSGNTNEYTDIEFDQTSTTDGWTKNGGNGGGLQFRVYRTYYFSGGFGNTNINYSNNAAFNTGIYINISFLYSSTLNGTISGILKVEYTDLLGNIIFSSTQPSVNNVYSNSKMPVMFNQMNDVYTFYNGIFYCNTGYVNYSIFSKYI